MKVLLVVAHGSRRESSNNEVRELAKQLAQQTADFDLIDCAFLEIAEPSIPQGLEMQITRGAKEIVVMPYFLAAGRHVVEDIPKEVASIQQSFEHIEIRISPHLGLSQNISGAILELANENDDLNRDN